MTFISYAQNFEDVILWRALRSVSNGFYIDIGANDPEIDSVSKAFYQRGWRGVHVEALASCARKLRETRPDEVVIESAVSEQGGVIPLFELHRNDLGEGLGISTVLEEVKLYHQANGFEVTASQVPCITLDVVLNAYADREIHWLKIDVEGMEASVIRGWRTAAARPWIVVVEAVSPTTRERNHQEWEEGLLQKGYRFVYFDGLNRFYLNSSHPELAEAFSSPPNVFDQASLSGTATHGWVRLMRNKLTASEASMEKAAQAVRALTEVEKSLVAETERLKRIGEHEAALRCEAEASLRRNSEDLAALRAALKVAALETRSQLEEQATKSQQILDQLHAQLESWRDELEVAAIRERSLRQQTDQLDRERLRLRSMLYSASIGQHLYRAWRVFVGDTHYRQRHRGKRYSDRRVPWHTHLYRSGQGLFVRGEKPWHTHFYRGWRSLLGDPRYALPDPGQPRDAVVVDLPAAAQSGDPLHLSTPELASPEPVPSKPAVSPVLSEAARNALQQMGRST
jgi:FkbM family methyltransferase